MNLPANEVLTPEFVVGVIEHMNTDHAASLRDYAVAYGSVTWADSVVMTELLVTGIRLDCRSDAGRQESVWIDFAAPLKRQEQVRGALVAMAKQARSMIGSDDGAAG